MRDETSIMREIGFGLLLYILGPACLLFMTIGVITYGGAHFIDWMMTQADIVDAASLSDSGVAQASAAPVPHAAAVSPARVSSTPHTTDPAQPTHEPASAFSSRETVQDGLTETLDRTVSMRPDGRFALSNVSGNITITCWKRAEARIHAIKTMEDPSGGEEALDAVRVDINPRNGDVEILTRYPERRGWGRTPKVAVSYDVTLPEGASVMLNSVSGSIDVSAVRGSVSAKSISGRLILKDISNRICGESVSGTVDARRLKGDATLRSVSGSVLVYSLQGDLEANTTSGELELRDIIARQLSARSVSGNVYFEGPILRDGQYTMATTSGGIRLVLPPAAAFDLRANTFSGGIESELPMVVRSAQSRKRHVIGMVNGGGADVDLSAFSGGIEIQAR